MKLDMGFIGDIVGGVADIMGAKGTQKQNYQAQREANESSVQTRVADAKAAGIHPLYALGAPVMPAATSTYNGEYGNLARTTGQNLQRAITAGKDKNERAADAIYNARIRDLDVQKAEADIMLTQAQISALQRDQVGPPAVRAVSSRKGASVGTVRPQAATPVVSSHGNPAQDAGAINDYGYVRTDDGGLSIVPSADVKNRTEDNLIQESMWAWRNQLNPITAFGGLKPPSTRDHPLPPGYKWAWDWDRQAFYPRAPNGSFKRDPSFWDYMKRKY